MGEYRVLLLLDHVGYLRHFEEFVEECHRRTDVRLIIVFNSRRKAKSSQNLTKRLLQSSKCDFYFFDGSPYRSKDNYFEANSFFATINKIFWSLDQNREFRALSSRLLRKFSGIQTKENQNLVNSLTVRLKAMDDKQKIEVMKQISTDLEKIVKPSRNLIKLIDTISPSVILASPYINGTSLNLPIYVHAKKINLPFYMIMASWDNLENKNIALPTPKKIFVWSKYHKEILHSNHGADYKNIVVTGSSALTNWLRFSSVKRESNMLETNILYLCSSPFISSGKEIRIIHSVVNEISSKMREGHLFKLRIQVHPQARLIPENGLSMEKIKETYPWVEFIDSGKVTLDSELQREEFRTNVEWAEYCLGINTSALLEAACLDSPIFLISSEVDSEIIPETSHVRFLEKFASGVLKNLSEFSFKPDQKSLIYPKDLILEEINEKEKSNISLLDHILVDIQQTTKPAKKHLLKNSSSFAQIRYIQTNSVKKIKRLFLRTNKLRLLLGLRFITKYGVKAFIIKLKAHFEEESYQKIKALSLYNNAEPENQVKFIKSISKRIDKRNLQSIHIISAKKPLTEEKRFVKRLHAIEENLLEKLSSAEKIIVGPWFSELGHEVLYWIPLLNLLFKTADRSTSDIISISRSGAEVLYKPFSGTNINALNFYSQPDWHSMIDSVWIQLGGQKQSAFSFEENTILGDVLDVNKMSENIDSNNIFWMHPSIMFSMFRPFWRNNFSVESIQSLLDWPNYEYLLDQKEFVDYGMKFYSRPSFLMNEPNQNLVSDIIKHFATKDYKIIGNTVYSDDHDMFKLDGVISNRIIKIQNYERNLESQIILASNCKKFISTYGGLNYLPLLNGVESIGLYSNMQKLLPSHQLTAELLADIKKTRLKLVKDNEALEYFQNEVI